MNAKIVWVVLTLVLLVACGGNAQRQTSGERERCNAVFLADARAYYHKAESHWACRDFDEALPYADTAIALAKETGDREMECRALVIKAAAFEGKWDYAMAKKTLHRLMDIGLQPYADEARERFAWCCLELGEYEEALAALPDSLSEEGVALKALLDARLDLREGD